MASRIYRRLILLDILLKLVLIVNGLAIARDGLESDLTTSTSNQKDYLDFEEGSMSDILNPDHNLEQGTPVEAKAEENLDEECGLCHKVLGDLRTFEFDCSHEYHKKCVDEWRIRFLPQKYLSCPSCGEQAYMRIYDLDLSPLDLVKSEHQYQLVLRRLLLEALDDDQDHNGTANQDSGPEQVTSSTIAPLRNVDDYVRSDEEYERILERLHRDSTNENRNQGRAVFANRGTVTSSTEASSLDFRDYVRSEEEYERVLAELRESAEDNSNQNHSQSLDQLVSERYNGQATTESQETITESSSDTALATSTVTTTTPIEFVNDEDEYKHFIQNLAGKESSLENNELIANIYTDSDSNQVQYESGNHDLEDGRTFGVTTVDSLNNPSFNNEPNGGKSSHSDQSLARECCICYEDLSKLEAVKWDCSHEFHKECVRKWINQCRKRLIFCPICRQRARVNGRKYKVFADQPRE